MKGLAEEFSVSLDELLWPSTGGRIEFPEMLRDRLGYSSVLGFPSGRSALQYALLDAGISTRDDVLLPAYTAPAVDQVVRAVANPVYVDVEPGSYTMDPDLLDEALTDQTAAILPSHMYGKPCPMDEIAAFAANNDLVVVEDAAQGISAMHTSDVVGRYADYCAFSLRFSKDVALYTGGVLLLRGDTDVETEDTPRSARAKLAGVIVANEALRRLPGPFYGFLRAGVIDPLFRKAATVLDDPQPRHFAGWERRLAAAQFEMLAERVARRRDLARIYDERLPDWLRRPDRECHSYFRYPVLIPRERDDVVRSLWNRGVGCSTMYRLSLAPPGACPNADRAAAEMVNLPLHATLTRNDVSAIADEVTVVWEELNGVSSR